MAERMYENMEMQKRHEESQKSREPEAQGSEGDDMDGVVAEHGPADEVEIHSRHGKHTHKSKHHDAESAHEHISKAFGEESPEHEAKESPEFEAGEQEGKAEGIPGMQG